MPAVLVIDDEKPIRDSFALALEDSGNEVHTADSGRRGVELLKQKGPDLIFLDLKMPEMDGVQTLRAIRELNTTVPVYIVTAFHKEYLIELKAASGAGVGFELLRKPVGGDEIRAIVEHVLSGVPTGPGETGGRYILKLYVAGTEGRKGELIAEVRRVATAETPEVELEVIDILEKPELIPAGVVATPTAVREIPGPLKSVLLKYEEPDLVRAVEFILAR